MNYAKYTSGLAVGMKFCFTVSLNYFTPEQCAHFSESPGCYYLLSSSNKRTSFQKSSNLESPLLSDILICSLQVRNQKFYIFICLECTISAKTCMNREAQCLLSQYLTEELQTDAWFAVTWFCHEC